MFINIDQNKQETLTDQITTGMQRLIDCRQLRPDTRIPSIRQFATTHKVSKYTVVQAYDRLVASGHIHPRQGVGFVVARSSKHFEFDTGGVHLEKATDQLWLIRQMSREQVFVHRPGSGWLPPQWLEESGLERALRDLSRKNVRNFLGGYGDPRGFAPLREDVRLLLSEIGIEAATDQILLTSGITGAIDLAARYFIRPGDVVLVDDPGYFQTFGHMRALGAKIYGVRWTSAGPDLEQLEELAKTHSPQFYVTTPLVQNPTGLSISQGKAFRLLQIAERYDFYIIEDDVDGTAHPVKLTRLAGMDDLNRVIYTNGFSKSLSPKLRVGYLVGHRDYIRDLVDLKSLTQAASSEISERLVHELLCKGFFRKHSARLLNWLMQARPAAIERLEEMGLGPVQDDAQGLFAWMDVPGVSDTTPLAKAASKRGMLLAPGSMFKPESSASTKMRFNVAYCQNDEVFKELHALLSGAVKV